MSNITDNLVDEIILGIGQHGKPYYYDFIKGRKMDLEAQRVITPVNSFLEVYQRLTGKTIGSLEKLKQLLEQGTNLWNEETFTDSIVRVADQRKQEEQGLRRDKALPFFGVDLTDPENIDLFLSALKPLYVDLGYQLSANDFGYVRKRYNMKPLFFGDRYDIKGNELITTEAHAEWRDTACRRYATTPEQQQRVKTALEFIKPFRELEKNIPNKEIVASKSYVQEFGLPFPVCLVIVTNDRKELFPNPEYVEGVQLYPKARPVTKTAYNHHPFIRR